MPAPTQPPKWSSCAPGRLYVFLGRAGVRHQRDPLRTRLAQLGGTVLAGSAADFGKLFAEETEKWGKVIRAANIKVE